MAGAGDKGEFEYVVILDGSGNVVSSFGGGASMTDDNAFTPASSSVAPIGFFVDDTATDSVDEGDIGAPRMTPDRVILVGGNVAHDDADSGRPILMGGYAATAAPSAVSVADRVRGWFGVNGQQVIAAGISNTNHTGTNGLGMIDTSGTPRPLAVGMYNGSNYDSIRGDTTNGLDVDVTRMAALVAGSALVGDVSLQPRATNGLTTFMASGSDGSSILVATAQSVKGSAGKVYGWWVYNPEAAVSFVHFYNTASGSVTVGTTNPLFTLQVPAGAAANCSYEMGITFSTAITVAATTTAGGTGAPATGVSLQVFYA